MRTFFGQVADPDPRLYPCSRSVIQAVATVSPAVVNLEVIGDKSDTDLAVARVCANDSIMAPLSDSPEVHVGQLVVAIDTPYGYQYTITAEVVAHLAARSVRKRGARLTTSFRRMRR